MYLPVSLSLVVILNTRFYKVCIEIFNSMILCLKEIHWNMEKSYRQSFLLSFIIRIARCANYTLTKNLGVKLVNHFNKRYSLP
uniref:Uncharacterized protein n=1 Tax=Enterococcus faecium TaxID=1352 RepID=A0A0D5MC93_ENTFC|nr:hypothetical protein pEfm12493_083 [Enterococcus faecium]